MADVTTQKAEARAESMGYMCREVGDPRDSNPYLEHRKPAGVDDPVTAAFIAAWWRGWDQADRVLQGDKLP